MRRRLTCGELYVLAGAVVRACDLDQILSGKIEFANDPKNDGLIAKVQREIDILMLDVASQVRIG
jgi:hypothetical protein